MSPFASTFAATQRLSRSTRRTISCLVLALIASSSAFAAQVALTWADNASNEIGNTIERATGSGGFSQIATTAVNIVSYVDTSVAASTPYNYRVRAYNTAGNSAYSNTASVTTGAASSANTAPTISSIANRNVASGSNTGAVAFTIGDAETAAASLTLTKASSNLTLVPTANIVFGGSGANRTVTVTPASSQTGTATTTITVSDGSLTASTAFTLTVSATASNTAPTITSITSRTINTSGTTGAMAFTVGDAQTAAASLTVSSSSSNTTLVPNSAIVFGGSGANRTVTVTPVANQNGTTTITSTVSDGSLTASTAFTLTVTATSTTSTITIWPSATVPSPADGGADNPVEIGVKFRSDVAGTIQGLRFYKASTNTGTHVGSLWSSTGTLLATATFANETAAGWQEVTFSNPVAIAAGTVYVASYHCNSGHYSATPNYFLSVGFDNGTLHALANGVSGNNGVYTYGSGSVFPTSTWNATNYWVDVVFNASTARTLTAIAITPANPSIVTAATKQFTATGTYSDASTQNLSSSVTWGSSTTTRATISPSGLVTAVSAGTTTISATLGNVAGNTTLTVTGTAVNSAPTISSISNRSIAPGGTTGAIAFTIDDAQTTATSLTLAKASSNATLVPTANIVFGGSGATRTVTVTPAASQNGTATITITVSDGGLTASTAFTVTVTSVSQVLSSSDIGSPTRTGSMTSSNGTIQIRAGGTDIWGTTDQFHFASQQLTGDAEMIVRVASLQNTNSWAKAGLMFRASTAANAAYVGVFVTPGQRVTLQWRTQSGAISQSFPTMTGAAPEWLRLMRTGNTFYAFRSENGIDWELVEFAQVTLPNLAYGGLAVTSHNARFTTTATFDSFAID